jgi:hypothetical protein
MNHLKRTGFVLGVIGALFLAMSQASAVSAQKSTPPANKLVTVYLLIDSSAALQQYVNDLNKITKPNFNRVIFSFVRPTLTGYSSGNLANTGILGYFDNGDGNGINSFNQLKSAIALSRQKNIQTFLSVGGWNYSCNYAVYGSKCGDPATADNNIHYDWFPDPTDSSQANSAEISYTNLVKLANDLNVDGIDFDYEEFWHADQNALTWGPSSSGEWSTSIANSILAAGGPSYDNLMQYGTGGGASYVMPKTIAKVDGILHDIVDNPSAENLLLSAAATPVGGRPATGFVYGDTSPDIYTKGGLWWQGNLKGLWYHLADKDQAIVTRFDSLGLMTYDLCDDNPQTCAPYSGGPLDLPGQVQAYMKDYLTWLKAQTASPADLSVDSTGKVTFLPAKYQMSLKLQFGFEVNQPAYPQNVSGQMQLTNSLVNSILSQENASDGVIIWQMYSKQNTNVADSTTVQYTLEQSCKTFLAGDDRYDCDANFPSSVSGSKSWKN